MGISKKVKELKSQESMKKAGGVLEEFKTFMSRGNVMDLAVGVIVGGAFTSIVNSLVSDILMPVIGTILVGINFKSLGFTIPWGNNPYINIGSFLQSVITFLLTAACVFSIVKFINAFNQKKTVESKVEEQEEEPETSKEVQLLTEIRDLLSNEEKM